MERRINRGSFCFLVKDPSFDGDGACAFVRWLWSVGFSHDGKGQYSGVDWIYVNIGEKVFSYGMPGVNLASYVGNHAVTLDEFLTIYDIFKKYEGLKLLEMAEKREDKPDIDCRIRCRKMYEYQHSVIIERLADKCVIHYEEMNDVVKAIPYVPTPRTITMRREDAEKLGGILAEKYIASFEDMICAEFLVSVSIEEWFDGEKLRSFCAENGIEIQIGSTV